MNVRKPIGISFVVAGILLALVAAATPAAIYSAVDDSRRLERNFQEVGEAAEAFRRFHNRLPTVDELDNRIASSNRGSFQATGVYLVEAECIERNPNIQRDKVTYYISHWRGEWFECYYPETREHSLILNADQYAFSGAIWSDTILIGSLAAGCLFIAWTCLRRTPGPH
jgi:hypothetical protein